MIQVTQDDIDNGEAFNPFCCPIALALGRALNCSGDVEVCRQQICGLPGGAIRTPPQLQGFMTKYDIGRAVKPFEFELELTA